MYGGADEYSQLLINEIEPKAEKLVHGSASWRGLAGYSLAGLFALYSIYQTDLFSRVGRLSSQVQHIVDELNRRKEAKTFSLPT